MATPTENDLLFLKYIGRHLGVLIVHYVPIDKNGNDVGQPLMQSYSGFFIDLDGQWYFVTAGHVFKRDDGYLGLQQALDQNAIRIIKTDLADYFGIDARPHVFGPTAAWLPTKIELHDVLTKSVFVNEDALGLDFAFLPMGYLHVKSLKVNGIVPLTENLWQGDGKAMKYDLVGFPDEEKTPSATTSSKDPDASVRPCWARMDKCDLPPHLPKPKGNYFAAKLPNDGPINPVGFSGSPIFATDIDAVKNTTSYSLLAIDYKWHPTERIIVGCLMKDVVAEFRKRKGTS